MILSFLLIYQISRCICVLVVSVVNEVGHKQGVKSGRWVDTLATLALKVGLKF